MNLKIFNQENAPADLQGLPLVGIDAKSGQFSFNPEAVKLLGITATSKLQFAQNQATKDTFLVCLTAQDSGYPVEPPTALSKGTDHKVQAGAVAQIVMEAGSLRNPVNIFRLDGPENIEGTAWFVFKASAPLIV